MLEVLGGVLRVLEVLGGVLGCWECWEIGARDTVK